MLTKIQPYQALIAGLAGVGALCGLAASGVTTGTVVVPLVSTIVGGLMGGHLVASTNAQNTTKTP